MDTLRRPIFFLAVALAALIVLVELGALGVLGNVQVSDEAILAMVREEASEDLRDLSVNARNLKITERFNEAKRELAASGRRPGLAISYLALLDAELLFTVALMAAGLLVPQGVQGRTQGCATLIFSLILGLLAIVLLLVAIGLLLLMLSLLAGVLTIPVYIGGFGFFDRTGATITLGLLMLLKLGFAGSMVAANQRFLQNKGLVLITLTSILCNIIIVVLHNIVPGFLVSVTDAIAAIVIAVLAIIWAVVLLIGGVTSVARVVANAPSALSR